MKNAKIMVVEDESITALEIEHFLQETGYRVVGLAGSHDEALKLAVETIPDLILMDIRLEGELDGIKTAEDIQEQFDVPIIYLTAYSDYQTLYRAKKTRPYSFISKPFNDDDLHASIVIALNNHEIDKRIRENEYWLNSLLNSLDVAIIVTNQDGCIRLMNTHAEMLIECDEKHVTGEKVDQVVSFIFSDSREEIFNPCSRILESAIPVSMNQNVSMVTKNNKIIPIYVRGNPIFDEKGSLIGSVLVLKMKRDNTLCPF